MISFIIFHLAVFGVAWTIGYAKISYLFRKALHSDQKTVAAGVGALILMFLECPGCTSWWMGLVFVGLGLAPAEYPHTVIGGLFCAFASAASSLVLARVCGLLED